jgi:GTP-binding protein
VSGRTNRLKYITQIKTRPPTFAMWVSKPDKLPDSHKRFIINGLRRDYDIPGVPIRLFMRKSKNPFTD